MTVEGGVPPGLREEALQLLHKHWGGFKWVIGTPVERNRWRHSLRRVAHALLLICDEHDRALAAGHHTD